MVPNRKTSWLTAVFVCALCGCGGDGGGNTTPAPNIPTDSDRDTVSDNADCAPRDSAAWRLIAYRSVDADGDDFWVNSEGSVCVGESLDVAHSADVAPTGRIDCNDSDDTSWQLLPYASRDTDGDSHWISSTGELCTGASLPLAYSDTGALPPEDCDDTDELSWRWISVYADADSDGVGSASANLACAGLAAASGWSFLGYDPLDDADDPSSGAVVDPGRLPALLSIVQ